MILFGNEIGWHRANGSTRPAWVLFLVGLVFLVGCQRREPLRFTPSAEVVALLENAGDDAEDQQRWRDLQQEIAKILTERCGTPTRPKLLGNEKVAADHLQHGAEVYARRCQSCHGVNGDGNGPVAKFLQPRPRDYRKGIFKFTSTAYGKKPRRDDLLRTLRRGVTGTSMPSFDDLPPEDLEAVVDYLLALTHRGELEGELALLAADEEEIDPEYVGEIVDEILARWDPQENKVVMPEIDMPPMTVETVAAGHKWFLKQACNKCHGKDGRGGSMGGLDVGVDAWGNKAAAADLTSGMFRGGERPIDLYRRIHSGINGTPMPSFAGVFAENPEVFWQLVHFVEDLGQRRRKNLPPISATQIAALEAEIAAEQQAEATADQPETSGSDQPQPQPSEEGKEPAAEQPQKAAAAEQAPAGGETANTSVAAAPAGEEVPQDKPAATEASLQEDAGAARALETATSGAGS